MDNNIIYIRKHLKKKLDEDRYEHTLGVASTAVCLAMRYGEDLFRAEIAGLLHDCAKYLPDDIKLERCKKYNLTVTDVEKANPSLLHAKLGGAMAMDKYKIKDMDIINAISCHTTGKPAMNLLEKIIFVADYIEPRRDRAANLSQIRQMAFIDLDHAVWMIMEDTLVYLKKKGSTIDTMTETAYRYYQRLQKERTADGSEEGSNHL